MGGIDHLWVDSISRGWVKSLVQYGWDRSFLDWIKSLVHMGGIDLSWVGLSR